MDKENLLFLKPKMGLVPEISMQNYDTVAKQIREMISNSLDAKSKNVHVTLLLEKDSANLIVEDDGLGMDKRDLKEQFLGLGGSDKYFDKTKIGRIGIGFLASVPLCEEIEIRTRKKGGNKVIVAKLYSDKLTLEELRTKNIHDFPVGEIVEEIEDADRLGYKEHFTKLSLINIKQPVIENFKNPTKLEELRDELRKILPLIYDEKCKLFDHISSELKKDLIENADNYSLNVFLNSEQPLKRKVYGEDETEVIYAIKEFKEVKVDNMKVVGYFIRKSQPENKKGHELKKWDGLIVRVQNVAVVDSGFLGYEGYDERKKRVCGEISIIGIDKNKAITIDRNDFNEVDPQYLKIKRFIHEQLTNFFQGINLDWNLKSDLNKTIGVAVKLNKVMEKASHGISKLGEKKYEKSSTTKNLKNSQKVKLIDLSNIKTKYEKIKMSPQKGIESKKKYNIIWENIGNKQGEVRIDADIFDKDQWEFEIEKNNFLCEFVRGGKESKPCELDLKDKHFYINRDNLIIQSLKPDYIILCILIEYCRVTTNTKEEFAEKIFRLMGGLVE